jgi:hypothetical protein
MTLDAWNAYRTRNVGILALVFALPLAAWACASSAKDSGSGPATAGSAGRAETQGGSAGAALTGSGAAATTGGVPASGGAAGMGNSGPGGLAGVAGSASNVGGAGMGSGGVTGGSAGSGMVGNAGSGAGGSAGAGMGVGACTFTVTPSLSEKIGTVGIVEWTVDRPALDSATIQFGLDTGYGLTAPVDLQAVGYRTLLLGMKFGHLYHAKIVAKAGAETCESPDFTIQTDPLPNGLPTPSVTKDTPGMVDRGYTISEKWGTGSKGPSFILDPDFDFVWVYPGEDDVIRTRMSFDGKTMWIRNTAQTDGTGVVRRVTMDGLKEDRWELPHTTHDLAVIPDGHVALVGHAPAGCDEILDFNPDDGSLVSLFNASEAHGNTMCHVNYVAYFAGDDSFVFSDYDASSLIKITRKGDFVWGLNGDASTISGTSWVHEHGVHILAPDHLLVFSNGDTTQKSLLLEEKLDLTTMTATEVARYDAGLSTTFGGDIQRLPNGHNLITYSSTGVMQEVTQDGTLLQEVTWQIGNTLAYAERRPSLYGGPPPKIYE